MFLALLLLPSPRDDLRFSVQVSVWFPDFGVHMRYINGSDDVVLLVCLFAGEEFWEYDDTEGISVSLLERGEVHGGLGQTGRGARGMERGA